MTTEFPAPPYLDLISHLSMPQLCGQLLVVGFDGTKVPDSLLEALQSGLRGGVILFKRNLPDIDTAWALCRDIIAAYPPGVLPFIAVDQEGGRVCRLPAPFVTLPPMRTLGDIGDADLVYRAASEVGRQLAAIGITCNFAPVLDIDTNAENPVIGDRSFSRSAVSVAALAVAFMHGLHDQGILACGKHFPGHGDTALDSHLDLPCVQHSAQRLSRVELLPFREAIIAGLRSLMTAHVAYPALDPSGSPATLSAPIVTDLLRKELGFKDVVFSDDLEMRGIRKDHTVSEAACGAIRSGCDVLLLCHDACLADEALTALVSAAEADPAISSQILDANMRFHLVRQRFAPRPQHTQDSLHYAIQNDTASALLREIATRSQLSQGIEPQLP